MIPAAECLASLPRQRAMRRATSVTSRIIQAAQLRAGPALVTWSAKQVAEVERWLVDSTAGMPELRR